MKTNDFRVTHRCLQVLAQLNTEEWVPCQYITAAAMFPPEKMARTRSGRSSIAAEALRTLVTMGCAAKRKIGSTFKNEYQLTEKGWNLAKQRGFVKSDR